MNHVLTWLIKSVDYQGWPTTKNALKLSPKKRNLDQNISYSKYSYLELLFWKYYFGHKKLYICPDVPVDIIRVFFNFRFSSRKCRRQHKLAKKITHFTIQFRSKNLTYFTNINSLDTETNMLQKCNQKPFWLYKVSANMFAAPFLDSKELHSWTTLKANAWIFL